MLIKIYDLDATGLKMINLVKSPFFGQHRIITCCLLSESFQNQSQCFWVDSAPRDMLPLIPWYCGRSALHWEASFLAECLAGRLQRQEHSEQPAPAVPYLPCVRRLGALAGSQVYCTGKALCGAVSHGTLFPHSGFISCPVPIRDDESHRGSSLLSGGRVGPVTAPL